jgi:prepilin-type N-terminal cleavage/methylation domain-containing protein
MTTRRPPNRPGWTLVELLVVISIVSFLLATVAVTVQTLLRRQRDFDHQRAEQQQLVRLARQIRRDIHAAAEVAAVAVPAAEDGAEGDSIECRGPDGRSVSYQMNNGVLLRVVRPSAGDAVTRQPFRLPRGAEMRLASSGEGRPPIAAVQFDYAAASRTAIDKGVAQTTVRTLTVEAEVGRDLRWRDAARGGP